MTVAQANLKTTSPTRPPRLGAETAVALAGTVFSAVLLILTAMYAGPLWRDEANTINVAQMPSLKESWNIESFPPLWLLLLRECGFLGMADSDASIRVLGLYVGVFFLALLWLCSRWTGGRAPILSIALLGSLPAFIFIVGANRAYGLANCLLVLSFGMIWRMVELPSKSRVLLAGLASFLFVHCVYYDVVFLCAMLAAAALVAVRRRQWKTLGALAGIGAVSGTSMMIYLPTIRRSSVCGPMLQDPSFNFSTVWHKLGDAMAARSSAQPAVPNGPEVWFWIALLLGGSIAALVMQRARGHQGPDPEAAAAIAARTRADLDLFCVVSMLFGTVGYFTFLLRLHYLTQTWYYVELLSLCAISLDGILGANWPALRPWGLLRIGFMVVMMSWLAAPAWEEAHTRRSNLDLIAAVLGQQASAGDLIVVQEPWEGVTFDRYYHGQAHWVTVPPIDSHKIHRYDLVWEKLNQRDPMAPVLRESTNALRNGNSVWIVRHVSAVDPKQLPPVPPLPPGLPTKWWLQPYLGYWSAQVTVPLLEHAVHEQILEIPVNGPVSLLENLTVLRFSGYKSN